RVGSFLIYVLALRARAVHRAHARSLGVTRRLPVGPPRLATGMTSPDDCAFASIPSHGSDCGARCCTPLALGWVLCCCWACVAGGGVEFAGCVCADAGGTIALVTNIAVTNDMTLTECFI